MSAARMNVTPKSDASASPFGHSGQPNAADIYLHGSRMGSYSSLTEAPR